MIRRAEADDAERILTLYGSVKDSPFCTWNEYYPSEEEVYPDIDRGDLFVMEEDGILIGTISLTEEDDADHLPLWKLTEDLKTGELERVCVSPAFSGRGLALELVKAGEEILRERGCGGARLLCAKINLPAYRTYIKAGYSVSGECALYGSEYYAMEKLL